MFRRLKSRIFKGSRFSFSSSIEEQDFLPLTISFRSLILIFLGDSPALINSSQFLISSCSNVCSSLLRVLLKMIGFPFSLSLYPFDRNVPFDILLVGETNKQRSWPFLIGFEISCSPQFQYCGRFFHEIKYIR